MPCLGDAAKRAEDDEEPGRSMTSSVNEGWVNASRMFADASALGAMVCPPYDGGGMTPSSGTLPSEETTS